jgi:hypothetical protein
LWHVKQSDAVINLPPGVVASIDAVVVVVVVVVLTEELSLLPELELPPQAAITEQMANTKIVLFMCKILLKFNIAKSTIL